ncbi:YckD family protein [Neomoorella thermoacetica]|uniref:YckD family protein n=1 Tax=Neomoorella thermoacetica TaxID=1525 RepID=UPI00046F4D83|nr:YckD family protein [Moorella thermoacetica]
MKKKIAIVLAAVLMLVVLAPAAFAAMTDQQKADINALYQQIAQLRQQIIDKYVESGQLTKEQGDLMKQHIQQMEKYREKNGIGPGFGPGFCGGHGAGYGMMGGWGIGGAGSNPGQGNQNSAYYRPGMMRGYIGI